jgi:hypothetical protein
VFGTRLAVVDFGLVVPFLDVIPVVLVPVVEVLLVEVEKRVIGTAGFCRRG